MTQPISTIPISLLALTLLPALMVLFIQYKWSSDAKESGYAISRMLGQLLIVGYFLGFLFNTEKVWTVLLVLTVMVLVASWIGLRTVKTRRKNLYGLAIIAMLIGGGTTLVLVTQIVLHLTPWYRPQYLIPLAGMIFAGNMNCISLAAERYYGELQQDKTPKQARETAFRTALIPVTNSLFAVGLVSLPGMMTGQILSGVDPLIAVRYQIMVMAMIFGADGISSASFLYLVSRQPLTPKH